VTVKDVDVTATTRRSRGCNHVAAAVDGSATRLPETAAVTPRTVASRRVRIERVRKDGSSRNGRTWTYFGTY
jgi:hypothetical protein